MCVLFSFENGFSFSPSSASLAVTEIHRNSAKRMKPNGGNPPRPFREITGNIPLPTDTCAKERGGGKM